MIHTTASDECTATLSQSLGTRRLANDRRAFHTSQCANPNTTCSLICRGPARPCPSRPTRAIDTICRRPQVPNTTHLTPADARRNDACMDAPGWMAATNGQPTPRTWAEKEQRKALWMKAVWRSHAGCSEAVRCERLRPTASRQQHLSHARRSVGRIPNRESPSVDRWVARANSAHRAEQAQNGISRAFRRARDTASRGRRKI